MEIENCATIIIDSEGIPRVYGTTEELNTKYHKDFLKKCCLENYPLETREMKLDNGEYTVVVYAWFLRERGNAVYTNTGKTQYIFMPNEISENQFYTLSNLSDFFPMITNVDLSLKDDGNIETKEEEVDFKRLLKGYLKTKKF